MLRHTRATELLNDGVPIHVVSTSPDRDHTIMLRHPFLPD